MPLAPMPLSVLELATVGEGSTARAALQDTLAVARRSDALGFTRFWLAEHHNMPGIASSAPTVLMAAVGAATGRIRIGSGGVMLPNHAPLVVAEQFGTLEALYPGRIDLGLGRAPGTDPATARALRRTQAGSADEDFPRQLAELRGFLHRTFPAGHPYEHIAAVPNDGVAPPIWLLGSSTWSGNVAGQLGLPYAFAHHFSAENTLPALAAYHQSFRPSPGLARPYVILAVHALCAEDDETAQVRSLPAGLTFLRLRQGRPTRIPTVEQAVAHPWTDQERAFVAMRNADQAVGGPQTVRARLARLLDQTRADELMFSTLVHDASHRIESLERVRGLFEDAPEGWTGRVG